MLTTVSRLGGALALALVALSAASGLARAGNTSCDVITGASCSYGEGCDCDHDGYVRSNGKASRYCHFSRCPIDGDDDNPSVLGVPSQYNADGDAWTVDYDCDDHDPCVTDTCANICGPPPVDADSDGFSAGVDCDDSNFYIKPGATPPCCACEVLASPSEVAAYGCDAHPCQGGAPPEDTSAAGDASTSEDTAAPTDVLAPKDGADDDGATVAGQYTPPPVGPELVGSGAVRHGAPPPPGCAGGGGAEGAGLAALALALLALSARRRRRAGAAVLAVALAAGALGGGCVTVQPWERGRLAKAPMVFGADPQSEALEQHMFQYREGAAGGFGGGGGGCGCN